MTVRVRSIPVACDDCQSDLDAITSQTGQTVGSWRTSVLLCSGCRQVVAVNTSQLQEVRAYCCNPGDPRSGLTTVGAAWL